MSEEKKHDPFAIYHGLYFIASDGGPTGASAFRVSTLNDKELRCVPNRGAEFKIERKGHDKFQRVTDGCAFTFSRQSGSGVVKECKEMPAPEISYVYERLAGSEKTGPPGSAAGGAAAPSGPKPYDSKELREAALKKQKEEEEKLPKLYAPLATVPAALNQLLAAAATRIDTAATDKAALSAAKRAKSAAEVTAIQAIVAFAPEVLSAAWTLTATSATDETISALMLAFIRHISIGHSAATGLFQSLRECQRFTTLRGLCKHVIEPILQITADWMLDPPPAPATPAAATPASAPAPAADSKSESKSLPVAVSAPIPAGYYRSALSGLVCSPPLLVLECVLLGYQHSPELWLNSIPALMSIFESAPELDKRALVHLLRCEMAVFSGYDDIADVIKHQLNDFAATPRTHLQSTLYNAQWLVGPPAAAVQPAQPALATANVAVPETIAAAAGATPAQKAAAQKAAAEAAAAAVNAANVASVAAVADPNSLTTSPGAPGWVEGDFASKAAGGTMRWSLVANVNGTNVRGSYRRVVGKMRSSASGAGGALVAASRDLDPVTHHTNLAGFRRNQSVIINWEGSQYFHATVENTRQDELLVKVPIKASGERWVFTDALFYDTPVPSTESIVDQLATGSRPYVFAKRGSDLHYTRALLVKAEAAKPAAYVRESLTVKWIDRKEEVVSRDRMRLYRPCYTRVRGEMDAGSLAGVLHRNARGQATVFGTHRNLTNNSPSTYELHVHEPVVPAGAATTSSLYEESITSRMTHGDEEQITEIAVRARLATDNRFELMGDAIAKAGADTRRAAQYLRFGTDEIKSNAGAPAGTVLSQTSTSNGNAHVNCGGDVSLSFHEHQPFTIEAIVRLRTNQLIGVAAIAGKYHKGYGMQDWMLSLNSSRQLVFYNMAPSKETIEADRWTHVAGVYDGLTARAYIDGVLVREEPIREPTQANTYSPVTIGCVQKDGRPIDFFPGSVCEVRVWSDARTAAAIAANARRRLTGWEYGLVGYWPLVSLFGLAEDASALQNHGQVVVAEDATSSALAPWVDVTPRSDEKAVARGPVSDHFHTRIGDYLIAGEFDIAAGGVNLPLVLAAPAPTGAALWSAPATAGAAIWHRNKLSLEAGFSAAFTFGDSAAADARKTTAFVLHLSTRSLTGIVPIPPPPPPPKAPAHKQTAVAVVPPTNHQFSTYFASSPTAAVLAHFCAAVTIQPIPGTTSPALDHITVQLYTISSAGVYNTLAHSTHVAIAKPQSHQHDIVIGYQTGVHQITVDVDGAVIMTYKQNILLLLVEKHDSSVYVGVSSGVSTHVQQLQSTLAATSGDAKAAAAAPVGPIATSSLLRWCVEGNRAMARPDSSALVAPDSELQWITHFLVQVKEFEKWLRGDSNVRAWKLSRLDWLDTVNTATTLKDAINAVLGLFSGISWSSRWEHPERQKWEKELNSNVNTLSELITKFLYLEDHLPLDAMQPPWKGQVNNINDNRGIWLDALKIIRENDNARRRQLTCAKVRASAGTAGVFDDKEKKAQAAAGQEKNEKNEKNNKAATPAPGLGAGVPAAAGAAAAPPKPATGAAPADTKKEDAAAAAAAASIEADRMVVCAFALRKCDDDATRAHNWLMEKQPQVRSYLAWRQYENLTRQHWHDGPYPVESRDLVNATHRTAIDISGVWDASRGYLHWVNDSPFAGKWAVASYPVADGRLRGLMTRNVVGGWRFEGVQTHSMARFPAVAHFEFSDLAKMTGHIYYGGQVGVEWSAEKINDQYQRSQSGYSGLINLGNTCYQNSFLQSLFMTKQLRQSLLSVPLTPYPVSKEERVKRAAAAAAGADGKKPASGPAAVESKQKAASAALSGALSQEQKDTESSRAVIQRLQAVFAALQLSQRSNVNQLPLKSFVRKPYCEDKQDDSREYGGYLLSQLEDGLRGTPLADLTKQVFGGKVRDVTRCQECRHNRAREDTINSISVSFPKQYSAITAIAVVTGKENNVPAPEGFEKINIDLNAGRPKAKEGHMYMCVKRDPKEAPIVDLLYYDDSKIDVVVAPAGQELVPQNLNDGCEKGSQVFLAYKRNTVGSPITQITFTDSEKAQPPAGYSKIGFDVSRGAANKPLFLCFKKSTSVKDVKMVTAPTQADAQTLLPPGYDISGDINIRSMEGEKLKVFVAHACGGNGPPVTDLRVRLSAPVGVPAEPLPRHTTREGYMIGTSSLDLLVTRGHGCPIVAVEVYRAPNAVKQFSDFEPLDLAPTVPQSDEMSSAGWPMDNGEEVNWVARRPDQPIEYFDCYTVEGKYDSNEGRLEGILYPRTERSNAGPPETRWILAGHWKQSNYKVRQPFELGFGVTTVAEPFAAFRGRYMHGTGDGDWNGDRIKSGQDQKHAPGAPGGPAGASESSAQSAIINVCVVPKGGAVPAGYTKLIKSTGGSDAQLDKDGHYLCIQRAPVPAAPKPTPAAAAAAEAMDPAVAAAIAASMADPTAVAAAAGAAAKQPEVAPITAGPGSAAATAEAQPAPPGPSAPAQNSGAPATTTTPAAAATVEPVIAPLTDILVLASEVDMIPDGYEMIRVAKADGKLSAADAKYMAKSSEPPLIVCVTRAPQPDKKVLWDLGVVWGTEKQPNGWSRLAETPVTIPADLAGNQNFAGRNHNVFIVANKKQVGGDSKSGGDSKGTAPAQAGSGAATQSAASTPASAGAPAPVGSHPLDGEYSSAQGKMSVKVTSGKLRGWNVVGKYRNGAGDVRGVMWTLPKTGTHRFMGTYRNPQQKFPGVAVFDFDAKLTEMKGTGSFNETQFNWNGSKDSFAIMGVTRNYRSFWADGKEVFSSAAGGNTISAMVKNYFTPEVLDRSNWLVCENCKKKCAAERHPCVRIAPNHLMVVVKRFDFDYRRIATKILDTVDFEVTLNLPVPDPDFTPVVFENSAEKMDVLSNQYGLYAVVVHVGIKLEGGHYYCYARDSDSDLSLEDNPIDAPWTRYDDTRITRSSWKGMRAALRNSTSDTAYILFYRRIDARSPQSPSLVRAVTRSGPISDPKSAIAPNPNDSKSDVKSNPNAPPPEEPERDSVMAAAGDAKSAPQPTATPAGDSKGAAPTATAAAPASAAATAASAALAGLAAPTRVSSSLAELIRLDNARYLDELSGATTVHYLQHLNASIRAQTRLTAEWRVQLPAAAAAAAATATTATAVTDSSICSICRGSPHGTGTCPHTALVVTECPTCHLQMAKGAAASHFVTPPGAAADAPKQCINSLVWPSGITQPEPAVNASGEAPSTAPALVRATSVYSCPGCNAVLAGVNEFERHLASTGH